MRLWAVLSPILLAIAAPAAAAECTPLPGWEPVAANETLRWIVIGEMHGSNEAPALFADIVCLTARERPVVVAVEQSTHDQPALDAFMASDGGAAARQAFLQTAMWNRPGKDGRSSEAQFRLFETLRKMRTEGRIANVVAFVPVLSLPVSAPAYEQALADALQGAAQRDEVVIALSGQAHAMRTVVFMPTPYTAMAGHLPPEQTATFEVLGERGEQWACIAGECGVQPTGRDWGQPRGVTLNPDPSEPFSGTIHLGVPTTASPPAAP